MAKAKKPAKTAKAGKAGKSGKSARPAKAAAKRGAPKRSPVAAKKASGAAAKKRGATHATQKRGAPAAGGSGGDLVTVPDPASKGGSTLRVRVPRARGAAPSREAADEAAYHVKVLHDNEQISRTPGELLPPGATHEVEPNAPGGPTLVRRRYSAI